MFVESSEHYKRPKKQDSNPEEITEIVCSASAIAASSCPLG
jgi:hypothetical protein